MSEQAANYPPNASPGAILSEAIRRIVDAIDPDRIILFGSRARGNARADSDYDFLVIKDTKERTLPLEQAAYLALIGANVGPVDIIVETPQRVERLKQAVGTVFPDALKEGRLVYERGTR